MSEIDLNVDVGQTKTLTFNTKDKYNTEDIVFNISATDTLADWAKAATKPTYTWSEINNKPTFATVATSGSYNDLSDKPSLNYLPLTGGTMSGNLDMGGKYITNTEIYETNLQWGNQTYTTKKIIDTLLTQPGNRLACTPASNIDVEYSRDNGETWLDYGLTDAQKMDIFTSTQIVHIGKRYSNDGIVDIAKDRVRITWWSIKNDILSFYGTLIKFLTKVSVSAYGQVIHINISKLTINDFRNNTNNWKNIGNYNTSGWPADISFNNVTTIDTTDGRSDHTTQIIGIRFELSYDSTSTEQTTTTGAYLSSIAGFGNIFYRHYVGRTGIPYNNQPFTYDSYQNTTFPAKVTSQEPINYDAVIKPTQTGNTVTKTNNWVLQYLTQGVNWLRDNTLNTSNGTTFVSGSSSQGSHDCNAAIHNGHYYFGSTGNGPSVSILGNNSANDGALYVQSYSDIWVGQIAQDYRTGKLFVRGKNNGTWVDWKGIPYFNNQNIGSNNTPVYVSGGELKACETPFATLDSTGKVPTSQLPSYVDDVVEYTNRASFPATGEKGKIYVDTTENDIYRWTGSTYIKISGIIGAQGEKGAQGYTGLQGATGAQGKNGTNGTNGVQGYTGLQGKAGTNGTNGTNGVQGYQGYQGIKGTDGSRGVQGFQGIKGTDGANGATGAQGYQGYTGAQGKNGTNGTNGTNGVQGYQGIKGTDGSRGVQGYTGLQGLQGIRGFSGTNFVGCFISSYSLYNNNQYTVGTVYTFNKADFNLSTAAPSQGDTILVIYSSVYNNVTYIEHCYIKLTRFREEETTFMGAVRNWFKISDGIDGVQGYQGFQGISGTNGTSGAQGYRGYQGYTGIQGKQGLQGISGALATNHWYLDKANPEVTNNGSSILIQLDTASDSIFAKLSNLTNGPLNGRNFIVELADSDGNAMINNLFGDFSKYNVPNHVRYHFYIRNISKRQNPMKLNWDPSFYTNVPHIDGYAPQVVLNYGECCKIEFVKFDQTYSWVDVELEDITYNTSTAAASENNEDNAMSQIMNYCDNNKLSYVLDKESNNLSFNMIDVIASLCSKLK